MKDQPIATLVLFAAAFGWLGWHAGEVQHARQLRWQSEQRPSAAADLADAIMAEESGHDVEARRYEPRLRRRMGWSAAEATSYGPAQVVFGFWREACSLKSPRELENYSVSRNCIAKVNERHRHALRQLLEREPTLLEILAAYNAGPRNHLAGMEYARRVYLRFVDLRNSANIRTEEEL